ncbi:MAG: hypothetical protein IPM10_01510 [Chitinophagaceae bacterium]|nr:hypothetical protein [Chitinophagaceae bacterium]
MFVDSIPVIGSIAVPVILFPQLSITTGPSKVTAHSPVASGKDAGAVGAVTSSTITFCVAVDVLPLPSSNVQVMV